jgi:hypothetical protein
MAENSGFSFARRHSLDANEPNDADVAFGMKIAIYFPLDVIDRAFFSSVNIAFLRI